MAESYNKKTIENPHIISMENPMKNWTKQERYNLLQALKAFDLCEIDKIQEYVSTKTVDETQAAIDHFKRLAIKHPMFLENDAGSKATRHPQSPLTGWSNLLTDSLKYDELRTETVTALRMIADLENIPPPSTTDGINFKQIYHQIANAMEGKPLKSDLGTTAVLHKCLIETALTSRAFIKTASCRYIFNNIDMSDKEINMFPRPTKDHELSVLRHLASQRSYNPLKIPEEYLKPSCNNLSDDKPNDID